MSSTPCPPARDRLLQPPALRVGAAGHHEDAPPVGGGQADERRQRAEAEVGVGRHGVDRQRAGIAEPGVGVGRRRGVDVAPLGVGDDDQPGAGRLGDEPLQLGQPGRAVPLEEGDLWLDHAHRPGEPLDAAPGRKRADPWRRRSVPTAPAAPPTDRSPRTAARRADTAAATRSPKLSAIASSLLDRVVPARAAHRPPPIARRRRRRRRRRSARPRPDPADRRAVGRRTSAPAGAAPSTAPAGPGRSRCPPARRRRRPAAARPRRAPTITPPTPTIGAVGEGRPALPHGPHRHRVHGAPREPAAAGAEDGPSRFGVEGQAQQGVDQGQPVGTALERAARRSRPRRARWG